MNMTALLHRQPQDNHRRHIYSHKSYNNAQYGHFFFLCLLGYLPNVPKRTVQQSYELYVARF
jgi:hypothetical protein